MSTPGYAKQGTCDADAEDNGTGTLWSSILSLDWVYSWPSQYDTLLRAYASSPVMPTFLGEAQYEYQTVVYPGTPLRLRPQRLIGNDLWSNQASSMGTEILSLSPDTSWKKFIVSPGVTQLGFLRSLLSSTRWYDLIPDIPHRLLISGIGTYDSFSDPAKNTCTTAAIASDGTTALIYAPTIRTMTIKLSRFTRPVSARWFDPSTGHYHPIPDSPFSNSGTHESRPVGKNDAGDEDWVLVLSVDPTLLE